MNKFILKFEWNVKITDQLLSIIRLYQSQVFTHTIIDLSHLKFCPPLFSVLLSRLHCEPTVSFVNLYESSYFNFIYFPEGLILHEQGNQQEILKSYEYKTYVPIIKFSVNAQALSSVDQDNVIGQINGILRRIANLNNEYYMAVSYMISELVDNIVEHSNSDFGWLAFQYYKSLGFVDICNADSGRGVLMSYREYSGPKSFAHIETHVDAIYQGLLLGQSSKSSEERGYGIRTSKKMLLEGLGGTFIYQTGDALLYNNEVLNIPVEIPGTFALLRIPTRTLNVNFRLHDYTNG
jgi:hypothetical protein